MGQTNDARNYQGIVRIDDNVLHEGAVDLQRVYRKTFQVIQAGVAGTKIVKAQLQPHIVQREQRFDHLIRVVQQDAFGHLHLHEARRHAGLTQNACNGWHQRFLPELLDGEIDRQLRHVIPLVLPCF